MPNFYDWIDKRPCAYRRRAKMWAKRTNVVALRSEMYMHADIQRKRRAFMIRNGRNPQG